MYDYFPTSTYYRFSQRGGDNRRGGLCRAGRAHRGIALQGLILASATDGAVRVVAYLQGRCPEIIDVVVEDEWQLTDEANDVVV